MSVDLAVWEGSVPSSNDAALATFEDLSKRFLDAAPTRPTKKIVDYVDALLARYPEIPDPDDEQTDEVPWGSGPLIANASGPIVYIDMKLNSVFEEGWRYCVETAAAHGLIAFDPQSGTLANPDPSVAPTQWVPTGPRGGPVYRWISLRSWRWWFLRPLLRPLLPLFRRFL